MIQLSLGLTNSRRFRILRLVNICCGQETKGRPKSNWVRDIEPTMSMRHTWLQLERLARDKGKWNRFVITTANMKPRAL